MLARSKLNSIKSKIFEIIMKTLQQSLTKKKYQPLKESIRMLYSQRSDVEKINLKINLKEGKKNRH